jgi:hypothetical protein
MRLIIHCQLSITYVFKMSSFILCDDIVRIIIGYIRCPIDRYRLKGVSTQFKRLVLSMLLPLPLARFGRKKSIEYLFIILDKSKAPDRLDQLTALAQMGTVSLQLVTRHLVRWDHADAIELFVQYGNASPCDFRYALRLAEYTNKHNIVKALTEAGNSVPYDLPQYPDDDEHDEFDLDHHYEDYYDDSFDNIADFPDRVRRR